VNGGDVFTVISMCQVLLSLKKIHILKVEAFSLVASDFWVPCKAIQKTKHIQK